MAPPDPWTLNNETPTTWYQAARHFVSAADIRNLAKHPDAEIHHVHNRGTFVAVHAEHHRTRRHFNLRPPPATYWWFVGHNVSDGTAQFAVGSPLWSTKVRCAEIVAGFDGPRSGTALVRARTT